MRLKEYRLKNLLSREEAARQLGMDSTTLWRIETGAPARMSTARRIREWSNGEVTEMKVAGVIEE
jgi:transcriptional regulator with XRE-family HTH domain